MRVALLTVSLTGETKHGELVLSPAKYTVRSAHVYTMACSAHGMDGVLNMYGHYGGSPQSPALPPFIFFTSQHN